MVAIEKQTTEMETALLLLAREFYELGPAWAQEAAVLRRVANDLGITHDIRQQQKLLNTWQKLFREGRLVWGYNVENPAHPFFHFSDWIEHDESPITDLMDATR